MEERGSSGSGNGGDGDGRSNFFFLCVCECVFPRLESKQEEERNSGGRFECGCQGQSVTTTAGVS